VGFFSDSKKHQHLVPAFYNLKLIKGHSGLYCFKGIFFPNILRETQRNEFYKIQQNLKHPTKEAAKFYKRGVCSGTDGYFFSKMPIKEIFS